MVPRALPFIASSGVRFSLQLPPRDDEHSPCSGFAVLMRQSLRMSSARITSLSLNAPLMPFYRVDVQCDMLNLSWDGQ